MYGEKIVIVDRNSSMIKLSNDQGPCDVIRIEINNVNIAALNFGVHYSLILYSV